MMENQAVIDLRDSMVESLIKLGEDYNIVVLLSDSTSTSKITPFKVKYPERVIDVGIAEQNLVGVAVGLSLGGFIPITASAASFLVSRANEQIKNDVCYSNTNVKLVGLNAGVCYGPLASTHHAIDDISIMRGLGNIIVLAPADPLEVAQIFQFAIEYHGPVYIRLDNAKFPVIHQPDYRFELGKVDILTKGNDLCVFAMGSVVHEAYFAALELAEESINVEVMNISSIRPVDKQVIATSISDDQDYHSRRAFTAWGPGRTDSRSYR